MILGNYRKPLHKLQIKIHKEKEITWDRSQ